MWERQFLIILLGFIIIGTVSAEGQGWKFRSNMSNIGVYDDGGTRPNNQVFWKYWIGDQHSSPIVANGVVYTGYHYFSSGYGHRYELKAIDAETGILKWSSPLGVIDSTPLAELGDLIVATNDGEICKLDKYTGALKILVSRGDWIESSPAMEFSSYQIYIGSDTGNIYALRHFSLENVWKFPTGGKVISSPALMYIGEDNYPNWHTYHHSVFVGSDDGNIYALDSATGTEQWRFKTGGAVQSSPSVANDIVYVGSNDKNVYALNAKNGNLIWKFPTYAAVKSSPAVANGMVYIGSSDNYVYALDAGSGFIWWKFLTGGWVDSSPAVANGVVYIGSYDGNVYALDAKTGAEKWRVKTGLAVTSSPTVANGIVYVSSTDGYLYAIGRSPVMKANLPNFGSGIHLVMLFNRLKGDLSK